MKREEFQNGFKKGYKKINKTWLLRIVAKQTIQASLRDAVFITHQIY